MDETGVRLRSGRRSYCIVGYAFSLLIVVALGAQILIECLPVWLGQGAVLEQDWWKWVSSFAPMYLCAFPACIGLLFILPARVPEKKSLSFWRFMSLLPISFCLMYAGNIVGTVLSMLLSGGQAVNALNDYAMDQSFLKILVMVVLAPLLEELICRKLLIDRTVRYGEKLSVLMSGLIFGMLHQNLYQFFYAFALGSLFGYVYVRTGKLRYTVILHMIINFMGAVLAPAVLSLVNIEVLSDPNAVNMLTVQDLLAMIPGLLVIYAYAFTLLGLSVFGLVLLIIRLRRLQWKEAEQQLSRKPALKAAFINVGMILYGLICLVMTVRALFNR